MTSIARSLSGWAFCTVVAPWLHCGCLVRGLTRREPEAVNRSACPSAPLVGCSARRSTRPLLGLEPGEQDSNHALGRVEIFFAPAQRCTEVGQFCAQRAAIAVTVVTHIRAACWPDLHQALGGEHPDGGLGSVQRYPVGIPELTVRRYPATRWAGPADDLGPKGVSEPAARKTVGLRLYHTITIANRLKTEAHRRQRVEANAETLDYNCPRAAAARPAPTSPWPQRRCPSCGTELDGGPVVFWCAGCGRGVQAADLDVEYQLPGPRGRAA